MAALPNNTTFSRNCARYHWPMERSQSPPAVYVSVSEVSHPGIYCIREQNFAQFARASIIVPDQA